ncbi:MAG: hypothetical protein ACTHY4_07465 [Flavobacteriaceae bacterium]|nr:hypothetical protein [Psychroflexus sp.]
MAKDKDMMAMAEEGMTDYFKKLQDLEKECFKVKLGHFDKKELNIIIQRLNKIIKY